MGKQHPDRSAWIHSCLGNVNRALSFSSWPRLPAAKLLKFFVLWLGPPAHWLLPDTWRLTVKVKDYGLCRVTADGAAIVDAAHIEPFAVSQNDDIVNGLALDMAERTPNLRAS